MDGWTDERSADGGDERGDNWLAVGGGGRSAVRLGLGGDDEVRKPLIGRTTLASARSKYPHTGQEGCTMKRGEQYVGKMLSLVASALHSFYAVGRRR